MNEKTLKKQFKDTIIRLGGVVDYIEDRFSAGVFDVNVCLWGVESWVEFKYLPKYPVTPKSIIKLRHLTVEQINWANNRISCGSRVWVYLGIENDHFLFYNRSIHHLLDIMVKDLESKCNFRSLNNPFGDSALKVFFGHEIAAEFSPSCTRKNDP